MTNIFFTSDHHFGHANIIKYCRRPFDSVDEMNEELIRRWNEKVGPNDIVYHLGDFALCRDGEFNDIATRLNGTICLVAGNHEYAALNNRHRFKWVKDYFELKVKDESCKNGVQRIILLHYAMRVWNSHNRGTWHLYGHSHSTLPDLDDSLSFDVGVDCHDFYPLSYAEVKAVMAKKSWVAPVYDRDLA